MVLTVLVVEDNSGHETSLDTFTAMYFPKPRYDVVVVGDLMHALKILCDPKRQIAGAIVDNGFFLTSGTHEEKDRLGSTREAKREMVGDADEFMARRREGPAAAMLLRFMRTGKTGVEAQSSKLALQDPEAQAEFWLGDEYEGRMAALKTVPFFWNSADVKHGKVETIRATALGEPLTEEARFWNEIAVPDDNVITLVAPNTYCTGKHFGHIFKALAEAIKIEQATQPITFELCAMHGKEPKPETEFSLAVQYHRPDILEDLLSRHGADISAERISSAIAMIPPTYPAMKMVEQVLRFPRADVNAFHIIPMTDPARVCTPLYEAVFREADAIVRRVLANPQVKITQDVLDLAATLNNKNINYLLGEALKKTKVTDGVSVMLRTELPDPTMVKGFGLEVREVPKQLAKVPGEPT